MMTQNLKVKTSFHHCPPLKPPIAADNILPTPPPHADENDSDGDEEGGKEGREPGLPSGKEAESQSQNVI